MAKQMSQGLLLHINQMSQPSIRPTHAQHGSNTTPKRTQGFTENMPFLTHHTFNIAPLEETSLLVLLARASLPPSLAAHQYA